MTKASEAFNRSICDAEELLRRFEAERATTNHPQNGEVLKRAGLVMALAAWETYVKDRVRDEISVWLQSVDGSPIGKFVRRRLEEDLKRFFNPNSERTRRLFLDAAHQANTSEHPSAQPHKVKREERDKGIRFLKGLVNASERARIAK